MSKIRKTFPITIGGHSLEMCLTYSALEELDGQMIRDLNSNTLTLLRDIQTSGVPTPLLTYGLQYGLRKAYKKKTNRMLTPEKIRGWLDDLEFEARQELGATVCLAIASGMGILADEDEDMEAEDSGNEVAPEEEPTVTEEG